MVSLFLCWAARRPRRARRPAPASRPTDIVKVILRQTPACERAWPGYEALSQPLLLAFGKRLSLLLGARTLPKGFWPNPFADFPEAASLRAFEPRFSYVDDFDLDGTTTTALRLRTPLDAEDSARYFLHERFHRFQHDRFKAIPWEPYLVESPVDIALAAFEDRSLALWLESGDPEAPRDFAALRARRRRLFPGTAAELTEERNEGTAKFVDSAGGEVTLSSAAVRRSLVANLRALTSVFELHKWRAYAVGAALCRWLDAEKVPGWRRAVEGGRAPSEIVLQRLALEPSEVDERCGRLTRLPAYAEAERAAAREIAELREERDEMRRNYDMLQGRRLIITLSSGPGAGFSGNWIDYPGGNSLLIVAEWVLERPGLKIRLRDNKGVWRRWREHESEFVVPPTAVVTLDGARWTPKPGRAPFRSLAIADERIALTAGPGMLDDDGRSLRLNLPDDR